MKVPRLINILNELLTGIANYMKYTEIKQSEIKKTKQIFTLHNKNGYTIRCVILSKEFLL